MFKTTTQQKYFFDIISSDVVNTFTKESLLSYLNKTYQLNVDKIYPDTEWLGRGALLLTEAEADRLEGWEDKFSEHYDELEFYSDID